MINLNNNNMRRSDIWFFSVILIVIISIPFQLQFPDLEVFWNYFSTFWWVSLLPYVVIKMFFRKSRLFNWLNSEVQW